MKRICSEMYHSAKLLFRLSYHDCDFRDLY